MTRFLIYLSIVACAGSLASALLAKDYLFPGISVALLGAVWIAITLRGYYRLSGVAFAIFTIISLICLWVEVSPWLAFAGVTFSLLAWDLIKLYQRLRTTNDRQDVRNMERLHFSRLAFIFGLSVMGYMAAGRIHISLTFGAAALLALLGIWGISALVYRLRSHE